MGEPRMVLPFRVEPLVLGLQRFVIPSDHTYIERCDRLAVRQRSTRLNIVVEPTCDLCAAALVLNWLRPSESTKPVS